MPPLNTFIEKHIGWILLIGTLIYGPIFRFLGYGGLVLLLAGGILQFRELILSRQISSLFFSFLTIIFIYILSLLLWTLVDFSLESLRMTFLIIAIICVIFLSYCLNLVKSISLLKASIAYLSLILLFKIFNISLNIDEDGSGYGFGAYFSTKNSFAIVTMCFFVIFMFSSTIHKGFISKWLKWICIGLFLYLLYSAQARSVYLSTLVFLLMLSTWFIVKKNYFLFISIFALQICFSIYLLNYISNPNNVDNLQDLTESSIEHTGSRLNSGREVIWPFAIKKIKQSYLIGYGPSITLSKLGYESTLSLHNFYLQTFLQCGIIGFLFLELGLFVLWNLFWRIRNYPLTPYFASFMLAFMIHENFEVDLTQNNVFIGSLFWFIVGMGIRENK